MSDRELVSAFEKDASGQWRCVRPVTVTTPHGIISMTPGEVLAREEEEALRHGLASELDRLSAIYRVRDAVSGARPSNAEVRPADPPG